MCKVVVTDEYGFYKTCVISGAETPNNILMHYNFNPMRKIVYLNGKILSREKMDMPLKGERIHLTIRDKVIIRE